MCGGIYDDILEHAGFRRIGTLNHRMHLNIWWHADSCLQVLLFAVGSKVLVKGSKSYYLRSITTEGETHVRDIGPLQDYLESHFPELHLGFSFYRDITGTLAEKHIRHKMKTESPTLQIPTAEDFACLQQEFARRRRNVNSMKILLEIDSSRSHDLMHSYLRKQRSRDRSEIKNLKKEVQNQRKKLKLFQQLQREYERNGSAACLSFSICSNVQVAETPPEFDDALQSIVKELNDLHRYQVTQKLNGGRLNIQIAEAEEPLLVWLEEWLSGGLAPRQLERLGSEFRSLQEESTKRLAVTAKRDINYDGHVKEDQKLLGARIVSTLLRRLDCADDVHLLQRDPAKLTLPLTPGKILKGTRVTKDDFVLSLAEMKHAYVSGITGCGKSYAARVLIEEAAKHENLNVLVLDPRNQAAGLLVPEDREAILSLYPEFGMDPSEARGFQFRYFSPAQSTGNRLPSDLRQLGIGRTIVSFKGQDDCDRCTLFARILDAVFDQYAERESASPKLLIIIEEAQRFTKKRVSDDAKSAGTQAENALDRTVREGRKYGCCVIIVSQTIRDFAYDSASIRQNTNTKIFMHNSDREVDYAANFIGDGRKIIQLPPATAIFHNTAWGSATIRIRPPLSKVWEFDADETNRLVSDPERLTSTVSASARELIASVRELCEQNQAGVNISQICVQSGITSKRRIQSLLGELETAGLIQSHRLRERGNPRIIELIPSEVTDEDADETRTINGPME